MLTLAGRRAALAQLSAALAQTPIDSYRKEVWTPRFCPLDHVPAAPAELGSPNAAPPGVRVLRLRLRAAGGSAPDLASG